MNTEIVKIENETTEVVEQAKAFSIEHQISYENAAKYLVRIKGLIKEIRITFDPIIKKAHEAHKEATSKRNLHLDPVVKAEEILKGKIKTYEREAEKKAEEARRKAEEDRQKKIDEENEKRKEEAALFDEKPEEVNPEDVETEQPLPTIDRVKGLGIRKTYHAKVLSMKDLPLEYHLPDMMALNKLARDTKSKAKVPGVAFVED